MSFRLMLNVAIRDNYTFCDLEAPLVLNLSNPSGTSTRITDSILRALHASTIIDLDNVIDLETNDYRVADAPVVTPSKKTTSNADKKAVEKEKVEPTVPKVEPKTASKAAIAKAKVEVKAETKK